MLLTQKPLLGTPINWAHPLAKGLVGCWIMNEGSGDKIYDLSGNGNDGVLTNGPIWVPGRTGPALDFDGSDDYVVVTDSPTLNLQERMTITAWIKHDVTGAYEGILQKGTDEDFGQYEIHVNISDKFTFIINNSGSNQANSTTNINSGQWYHVAATWDKDASGLMTVYVNGAAEGTDTFSSSLTEITGTTKIGRYSGDLEWNGIIDEVRIYNRALTAAEILWLYREPYAMFERKEIWEYYIAAVLARYTHPGKGLLLHVYSP